MNPKKGSAVLTLVDGEARSKRGTPMDAPIRSRLVQELARVAGGEGRPVQVSVAELAGRLRVSKRTVQRALADLACSGRVIVEPATSRYTPNRYTVPG